MKLLLAATCLCVLLATAGAHKMSWAPCENAGPWPVTATSVVLTPDPAVIASTASFRIKADNPDVTVKGGALAVSVLYEGEPIFQTRWDLCGKIGGCPQAAGKPVDILYEQILPPIAPPGPYMVKLSAQDDTDTELLCLEIHFDIVIPGIGDAFHRAMGGLEVA